MKDAKHLHIRHWSGEPYDEEPNAELCLEHTIDEVTISAVWGFKIFESISSVATMSSEMDMMKYRALASVLGAGRVNDSHRLRYWFEGRELAVLYAGLCNLQVQFLDKSRMNIEKTLMRSALENPSEESAIKALRCAIKCQAAMMVAQCSELLLIVQDALDANHRVLLRVA